MQYLNDRQAETQQYLKKSSEGLIALITGQVIMNEGMLTVWEKQK